MITIVYFALNLHKHTNTQVMNTITVYFEKEPVNIPQPVANALNVKHGYIVKHEQELINLLAANGMHTTAINRTKVWLN